MIRRVVKMTFREEKVEAFEALFEAKKQAIRNFPGCRYLELWKESGRPFSIFSFSIWEDEQALETYRHSELFQQTWAQTKPLFSEKAQAWTLQVGSQPDQPAWYLGD